MPASYGSMGGYKVLMARDRAESAAGAAAAGRRAPPVSRQERAVARRVLVERLPRRLLLRHLRPDVRPLLVLLLVSGRHLEEVAPVVHQGHERVVRGQR